MQRSILLTGLLATSAVGISVSTFATGQYNTATDNPPTATSSDASFTGFRAAAQTPAGLICYDDVKPYPCYGMDRDTAIAGIEWFCGIYKDSIIPTTPGLQGTWTYTTNKLDSSVIGRNIMDEGTINMTVRMISQCDSAVQMNFAVIENSMKTILDQCDTDGENGKHGGYLDSGCLRYEFQPNPVFWPNCMYENCLPGGACTTGSVSDVGGTLYTKPTAFDNSGDNGGFP